MLKEIKRIIQESEVLKYAPQFEAFVVLILCREDDKLWPMPDRVGRQELEIIMGDEHISFTVRLPF